MMEVQFCCWTRECLTEAQKKKIKLVREVLMANSERLGLFGATLLVQIPSACAKVVQIAKDLANHCPPDFSAADDAVMPNCYGAKRFIVRVELDDEQPFIGDDGTFAIWVLAVDQPEAFGELQRVVKRRGHLREGTPFLYLFCFRTSDTTLKLYLDMHVKPAYWF
ncbi:hypothetical protein WJX73_007723 [Symbiochloris irregularis]|uniref:Uncharacterized protein n=1 Tax=Symbiochloris irregularis TaxID=706552 RepID=A0AAW1NWG0_9CHLO